MDTSHLTAIHERLWREKARLANATGKKERALRQVWVNQTERELAREMEFLGIEKTKEEMSNEELMKAAVTKIGHGPDMEDWEEKVGPPKLEQVEEQKNIMKFKFNLKTKFSRNAFIVAAQEFALNEAEIKTVEDAKKWFYEDKWFQDFCLNHSFVEKV